MGELFDTYLTTLVQGRLFIGHLLPSNVLVSEKEAVLFRYSIRNFTILLLNYLVITRIRYLN